ncbi:MAG: PilN domain-containing protein, partial [Dehalococcoidia bacterium]
NDSLTYEEKRVIVKDELKRTVQFFNSNNPENILAPETMIYISGEFADDPESFESLSTELEYPVAPLTSPLKCPKQLDPSHYLVNVGLALKELPRESGSLIANINTLPGGLLPKPISRDRLLAIPAVVAGVIVIAAGIFVIKSMASDISTMNGQVVANNYIIEKKTQDTQNLRSQIELLEAQIKEYSGTNENLLAAYENIGILSDLTTYDMKAAVDSVETGITFIKISYSDTQLTVMGSSSTEEEIVEYARNLENTNRFFEVTITSITDVETVEGPIIKEFTLVMSLEGA